MKNWMNNSRFMYIVMLSVAGVILCIFIGFNLYLDRWASGNDGSRTEDIAYTYHLAMISADPSDAFWETMYGEAVPADGSSVAVLVPANEDNMNPSYVYSGISSAIAEASKNIDVFTVRTGEDRDFVSEETVRNLLLDEEKRPDVLVCLSAVDTISAYQCVRDYNLVGQVKIIGTYVSTEILEGIGNGVIQSTIVVDAREAGQRCMQAMSEYMAQRYTNEYFPRFCNRFRDRNLYLL